MQDIEIPKKWCFNHAAQNVYEGFGLTEDRADELVKAARIGAASGDNQLEIIENALNEAGVSSLAEVIFVCYAAGILIGEKIEEINRRRMLKKVVG